MKRCTSCKLDKPFEDFRRQSKTKDGYKYRCKACDNLAARAYYEKKKKKIIENALEWQKNNPDKVKEYKKKYYSKK